MRNYRAEKDVNYEVTGLRIVVQKKKLIKTFWILTHFLEKYVLLNKHQCFLVSTNRIYRK